MAVGETPPSWDYRGTPTRVSKDYSRETDENWAMSKEDKASEEREIEEEIDRQDKERSKELWPASGEDTEEESEEALREFFKDEKEERPSAFQWDADDLICQECT